MPHNIGEMFYFGDLPWHGLGNKIDAPANLETAMKAGGLDWTVSKIPITTRETPPSPTDKRVAVVRDDREPGTPGRVLGVVHKKFVPLQNREGMEIFDRLLASGAKYHTGGYLGKGERVWLMARISEEMKVSDRDAIEPYVLFSNSHDGSQPVDVRFTTVRVVCQNTLNLAIQKCGAGKAFKRRHDGCWFSMEYDLGEFLKSWISELRGYQEGFKVLSGKPCADDEFNALINAILPLPKEPSQEATTRTWSAFETRKEKVAKCQKALRCVWDYGVRDGNGLFARSIVPKEERSLWGALNTVTATVDHILVQDAKDDPYFYAVFGQGAELKSSAWQWVCAKAPWEPTPIERS